MHDKQKSKISYGHCRRHSSVGVGTRRVALCSAAAGGAEVTDPTVGDRVGNNAPAPAEDTGAGESTVSAVVAAIVAVAVILLIIALMPRKKQDQT